MYNYTISKVAIGAASTQVVAINLKRKILILCNDSDAPIYVALGETAIVNQGIVLTSNILPDQRIILNGETNYTGVINAISTGAGKNLSIIEGE
jgi:hypothetical protein